MFSFFGQTKAKPQSQKPPRRPAQDAHSASRQPSVDAAISERPTGGQPSLKYGVATFFPSVLESDEAIAEKIQFHEIINDRIKLGTHLYARIAVAELLEGSKTCVIFADKASTSPDEVDAVVGLLRKRGYNLVGEGGLQFQGYFATPQLVIALSQGHLNAAHIKSNLEILRDPKKNSLFTSFTSIVSWAYQNKADDLDFAVDVTSPNSQICFMIGGKYIRPKMYKMPTDTMVQILGIAWQKANGGGATQFQIKEEQQAQLELTLPKGKNQEAAARVRLRWSGLSNDKGTAVTMRLQRLGDSAVVKSLDTTGYLPFHLNIFRRVLHSEGGIGIWSGVVGSGKSTSLAQALNTLPPHLKIQSVEDPVELEIRNAYQRTVVRDLSSVGVDPSFASVTRGLYRSALHVLYLGEIRDLATGQVAQQVAQSGHSVYTTIHASSALGIVDRMCSPAIGVPRDVLGAPGFLKLLVNQALLPVNCPHCALTPDDYPKAFDFDATELDEHNFYFERLERLYDIERGRYRMLNKRGCSHCLKVDLPELNGLAGRTVVCEIIEPTDTMLKFIRAGMSTELREHWRSLAKPGYDTADFTGKTTMECSIYKAAQGLIDPREIEPRFMSFETVEAQRLANK